MDYDFDTVIDRTGSDSEKWNVGDDVLPMWVADMDFKTAPEILDELNKKLEHGIFGYTALTDEWYSAYINWWDKRHGLKLKKDGLMFCTGVIPAISSIVRKLTTPDENVLIQTPVYNIFFNSIVNNGCRVQENPLRYSDGAYSMDFEDLEKKMSDPQTNLMILCNPQNPVGKIWDKGDLKRIGELAQKYHVTVIADEIHCDITEPGKDYVPYASVSEECRENSISCFAPTKTFNIAGLQTSAIYVQDDILRHKVHRAINTDEVAEPGSFAVAAAVAAFDKGARWLDALREYVWENRRAAEEFLKKELPEVKAVKADATYLVWLDMSALPGQGKRIGHFLKKNAGLFLSDGAVYGKNGESFLRMNIACPKDTCLEGLMRLKKGVRMFMEENQ